MARTVQPTLLTPMLLALVAGGAASAQPAQPAPTSSDAADSPLRVSIPLGSASPSSLRVNDPRAAISSAVIQREPVPIGGKVQITLAEPSEVTLHARVIVRFDDASSGDRAMRRLARDSSGRRFSMLRTREIPGAPGYAAIEASSVGEAIALVHTLADTPGVREAFVDAERPMVPRSVPTDPGLDQQWHMRNTLDPIADANLDQAWSLGYTGLGVVIGIVDIGTVQTIHEDLAPNFLPDASILTEPANFHATSVSGIAVAKGNNGLGGAGAAYDARFGTMPIGAASVNAEALAHRNDLIAIKNNSWGPPDDGFFHAPTSLELASIREAATSGRAGLGTILVWAAGNGSVQDRVDYDGFASSMYTIAVGGIDDDDDAARYNETGSSMLCVAHSSGGTSNRRIFTTDLLGSPGSGPGNYTDSFGGTSASAPLAAGVIALALQARPDLSWRDIQHLVVNSARKNDPDHFSWAPNGAGHLFSERYGFGAIDAGAMVAAAIDWDNVPDASSIDTGTIPIDRPVPDDDPEGITETIQIDQDLRIEHVEIILNVQTTWVGDLQIELTSPHGTTSVLAEGGRSPSADDLVDFRFTSVKHWDELAQGLWTVRVADLAQQDLAQWLDVRLVIHGTEQPGCPADLTGSSDPSDARYGMPDGLVTPDDFLFYLALFESSDPAADLVGDGSGQGDPDGVLDANDFFAFLNLYTQGCP